MSKEQILEDKEGGTYLVWVRPFGSPLDNKVEEKHKNKILVLLPGITANHTEPYMQDLSAYLVQKGFNTCVYLDRRTSPRSILKSELKVIDDFKMSMSQLQQQHPESELYAISISYGTSILVNYLSQMQEKSLIKAGVVVSSPFDFYKSKLKIQNDHLNFYEKFIVKQYQTMLKANYQDWKTCPSELNIDIDEILEMQKLDQLDEQFHEKVVGKSIKEFYQDLSLNSHNKISRIVQPLLFIQSNDDPFCDSSAVPRQNIKDNPHTLMALTKRGSHVAWWTGNINPQRWYQKPCAEFIEYISRQP